MVKHIVRGFFSLSTIQKYYSGSPGNQLCTVVSGSGRLFVIIVGYSMEKRWLYSRFLLFL